MTLPVSAISTGREAQRSLGAVRRRNIRGASPAPDLRLDAGDILVLMGEADRLVKAEARLLHGG